MSTETMEELPPSQQEAAQSVPPALAEGQPSETPPIQEKVETKPRTDAVPYTRFQQVNTKFREAEQRAAQLERQLAEIQGARQPQGPQRPDPSQFNTREEFDRAVDQYIEKVSHSKVEQTAQTYRQQQEVMELVQGFNARLATVAQTNPDYIPAVQVFASMEADMDPQVFRAIVADEDGPRIAWEIANDPEFAQKILESSPAKAGRLIERRLSQAQTSNASQSAPPPKPPIPVTKTVSGPSTASKKPEEMTTPEYIAWRESQER